MRTARICLMTILVTMLLPAMAMCALAIGSPSVQPVQFSPTKGESVKLVYTLSAPAKVRICIYSPDDVLVRTVINWEARTADKHADVWDGKDDRGKILPYEAYYFTVEARDSKGTLGTYDPA